MDRRQEKTKQAILQALIKLIDQKGLDQVSVSDLCQQANINRSTFYLHYKNIDDLLLSVEADFIREITDAIQDLETEDLIYNSQALTQLFTRILESIEKNSDLIITLMSPTTSPRTRLTIEQAIENIIIDRMNTAIIREATQEELPVSKTYIAVTISSLFTGIVAEWLLSGKKESPQDLGQFISEVATQPMIDRVLGLDQ
ncbi:Uncharacterized HTH-type transcriptional regulator yvdT [Alloiococcus otitis]|uniref:HTH tetR-type domain-containing protein n=1 Tax=Alloiococcus otitis ATCC 51267 TaxID=883081 RepID=K9ERF6_9LACT|nr:TetR/AcrR family transcriptional regulator [Alloiococcus otitis]EKU93487.1 hypothetical protein HMPREF9698_01019 [Alloiococcus otitis ATCC 51267]SUU81488.1 Uncharacterized HTH-type transcriptional regulator yvdT [Alloiococcus otitis]